MLPELRFGRFIIDGLLGPGGVTETYLAHDPRDSTDGQTGQTMAKLYAVKLLRQDRIPEKSYAQAVRRFVAAGRQIASLKRPGLGNVVEVSEGPTQCFIASEYVAGRDLVRMVEVCRNEERQGLKPGLAGLVAAEVARLLHLGHIAKPALHHLGLGPGNVIVTEMGEVVLLDAGVAAALRTLSEQPPERWAFVAPELQDIDAAAPGLGERQKVAADLFSLGRLTEFLLSGQIPQVGPGAGSAPAGSEVPAKLTAAIRTLVSMDPEDRPESASRLVDCLADGVGSVRERQVRIAEGIRAAEQGRVSTSSEQLAVAAERLVLPRVAPGSNIPVSRGASVSHHEGGTKSRGGRFFAVLAMCGAFAMTGVALSMRWQSRKQVDVQKTESIAFVQGSEHSVTGRNEGVAGGPMLAAKPTNPESQSTGTNVALAAGHLVVETVPPGAMVWVDGVLAGRTFVDLTPGRGEHRILIIMPGHRMFRGAVDASAGAIIRQNLVDLDEPSQGDGFIEVKCRTRDQFPILLDEQETGLLCPARMIPTTSGKHVVGVFLPSENRPVSLALEIPPGPKPVLASFDE